MTKNIFKKSVFTLLLGIVVTLNSLPLVALATSHETGGAASSSGATDVANPTEDQLLQQFKYKGEGDVTSQTKIGAVNALPHDTWQVALSGLVKILLNIAGALTLLALTVGGVFLITAHGSTDMLDKGKKIIIYSIGGLIVIAVSYAIVIGVSELQFFTPGASETTSGSAAPGGEAPAAPAPGATEPSGTANE